MDANTPPAEDAALSSLRHIFLWLHSGCNSRCIMCDIWKEKPGNWVTADDVSRWAPEWQRLSVQRVILLNEPLMHPQLWDIAKIIRAYGIRVELLSNGFLVERHAKRIVDNCSLLRVSLDGPPVIHEKTRGVKNAFEKLRRGIESLRHIRADYIINAGCVVHRGNFRYLRETVATARELGINNISFTATDVHSEEMFRRAGNLNEAYVESLIIRDSEIEDLERTLETLGDECSEDFASGFINDTPADLKRLLLGYYKGIAGSVPFPAVRCNSPWRSAVIEYDGTVRPCFPLAAYGNIRDHDTLSATINSNHAKAFRTELNVQTNATCQRCVCQLLRP